MIRLWRNAWTEFVPFLDYDAEIRRVTCSTNAIESLNARYRRAVRARGHFPTEQAALKCLYLVTRSLDPTGAGRARWTMRWKPVIDAFAITFGDRWPAAEIRPVIGSYSLVSDKHQDRCRTLTISIRSSTLSPHAAHPAFHDRIRPRCLGRSPDGPSTDVSEDRVAHGSDHPEPPRSRQSRWCWSGMDSEKCEWPGGLTRGRAKHGSDGGVPG
jgi:hypothetical protein